MTMLQKCLTLFLPVFYFAAAPIPDVKAPTRVHLQADSLQVVKQGQLLPPPTSERDAPDRFFVKEPDQSMHCYGAEGKQLWSTKPIGAQFTLVGSVGKTALVRGNNKVMGISRESGEVQWSLAHPDDEYPAQILDRILLLQEPANVSAYNPQTGKVLWQTPTDRKAVKIEAGTGVLAIQLSDNPKVLSLVDSKWGESRQFNSETDIRWFGFNSAGDLLILKKNAIYDYALSDLHPRWSADVQVGSQPPSIAAGKAAIAIVDTGDNLARNAEFNAQPMLLDSQGHTVDTKLNPVFYQSPAKVLFEGSSFVVYSTDELAVISGDGTRLEWTGARLIDLPPIQDIRFDGNLLVTFRQGRSRIAAESSASVTMCNRTSGRLLVNKRLDEGSGTTSIRSWTLIHNAVVFDSQGVICLLKYTTE